MNTKQTESSPCLICRRVKHPETCDNKKCPRWEAWFLGRWEQIHGFYEKYAGEAEK